jgi:hypothetical protein
MLAEAVRTEKDAWESQFDKIYKGRTYIFTSEVITTPTDGTSGAYEIDYVVLPRGESTRFGDGLGRPDVFARIDLNGFELLEMARPSKGNTISFGCRLASLRRDDEKKHWVVQLMPKGGVFMTHSRAMEAVGGPVTELTDTPREEGQP